MRVLFISNNFPTPLQPTRGMPNFHIARSLARRHQVVVISQISWLDEAWRRRGGGGFERVRTVSGMEVHHPRYYYPPGALRTTYAWFLWRSIRSTVTGILRRFTPDVVLAGWVHPDGDSARRIAELAHAPSVVRSGGSDVLVHPRDPARRRRIVEVLARADAVICPSEHLKRAIEDLGLPAGKVRVVRNGVDRSLFSPGDRDGARRRLGLRPDGAVLLWVGEMVPVKGVAVLVDAFAVLRAGGVDARLCLVGDGPVRPALAAQAAQAGVEDRVMFAGNVPQEALPDWYRAADLTILPSYSEGLPNVLCESIACGTAFVASGVGGIPEMADSLLDRLVAPGDGSALAGAIEARLSLRDAPVRARLPGTWDDTAACMEAVFAEAIAAGHSRRA
jgi:teichuronic acid biosynthesis glycosyltransferase TuaC